MPEAHLKDLKVVIYSACDHLPDTRTELIYLFKQAIQIVYTKMN